MKYQDGYLVETENPQDSYIIWGEPSWQKGFVSKGFKLFVSNLENASWEFKNKLHSQLANYLTRLGVGSRLQIKYEVDADYTSALERYRHETEKYATHKWDKIIRQKIYERFKRKKENGNLRRENIFIYIAVPMKKIVGWNFDIENKKDAVFFEKSVRNFFNNECEKLKETFHGCEVLMLDHLQLFKNLYTGLNKSSKERNINWNEYYDRKKSILENCLHSEIEGCSEDPDSRAAAFYSDGFCHNILQLESLPTSETFPFYGNTTLLNNDLNNYSVTVNIQMLDYKKEIDKKERKFKQLLAQKGDDPSAISLDAGIVELKENIYELGRGETFLMKVDYIIHIWEITARELLNSTVIMRNRVDSMNARLLQYQLGTQSVATFFKTLTGNLYYPDWSNAIEANHEPLATIIPFSASFTGFLDDAMALYDGDRKNIVGVTSFIGGVPQHSSTFGQSGSGKSVNEIDLLSQTHCYYDKVVIIEDGASYLMLTKIYEGEFIVINPNGSITLNYFDTCGNILSKAQMSFIVTLLASMCGVTNDEEVNADRRALILPYVKIVYTDKFNEFKKENYEFIVEIARKCITLENIKELLPIESRTDNDAFEELREALSLKREDLNSFQEQILDLYDSVKNEDIENYILENKELLRDVSYAYMKPEDFPTHCDIVDYIRNMPLRHHNKEKTAQLANRLEVYEATGPNGCLFDGPTNIDLNNPWIHIELGQLNGCDDALRSLVGIIIDNLVKGSITSMKRSAKKLYIFEEAPRILTIKGADDIMKQSYAQFRKYNCCAKTITQAMAQLWESEVADIICSQSKQLFLLKNKDLTDLDKIARYAALTDDAKKSIMNFSSPEHMYGEKYSSTCFYSDSEDQPVLGVIRNYALQEIIFAAGTSGDVYTKRAQQLRELPQNIKNMSVVDQFLYLLELENNLIYQIINKMEECVAKNNMEKMVGLIQKLKKSQK